MLYKIPLSVEYKKPHTRHNDIMIFIPVALYGESNVENKKNAICNKIYFEISSVSLNPSLQLQIAENVLKKQVLIALKKGNWLKLYDYIIRLTKYPLVSKKLIYPN